MADEIISVYDSDDSTPEISTSSLKPNSSRNATGRGLPRRSAQKNSLNAAEVIVILDDEESAPLEINVNNVFRKRRSNSQDDSSEYLTKKTKENTEPSEWCCDACTFRNDLARWECEICSQQRPGQPPLFDELLKVQSACKIASTTSVTECPVCFTEMPAGQGVVLSECLHAFCRECLVQTVLYCNVSEVHCPYMDVQYSCTSSLLVSEIRALLSEAQYNQYLSRSLREAEQTSPNAFHCQTPNCIGWWLCENAEAINFQCPVCSVINCMQCKVIHAPQTCDGYKQSKVLAKDEILLNNMINAGDIMKCPTCQALVTKVSGCDYLKCFSCRTMICWITKGPRWGPKGVGDTSAGCRCMVNGRPCHPKCNNCH